jgi:hypothetical protein
LKGTEVERTGSNEAGRIERKPPSRSENFINGFINNVVLFCTQLPRFIRCDMFILKEKL